MKIKQVLLLSTLALSLGTAPLAIAQPVSQKNEPIKSTHFFKRGHHNNLYLSKEQKSELRQYMKEMRRQIAPLVKETRALKLQLMGKIATPGTKWSDISGLVGKINSNQAQIKTIFAKTQLNVFQKLGVLLPPPQSHKGHHFRKSM